MNTLDLSHVDELITRALNQFGFPAAQYALASNNQLVASAAFGEADESTRFNIFSASKPIFASLVLKLIGEGRLALETRAAEIWPEFGAHGKDAITIEHLLLFTAGIPEWWPVEPEIHDRDARRRQAEELTLSWTPGEATAYHPLSAHWVLAEIVEIVTGRDYREAFRETLAEPLGLSRLQLGIPEGTADGPLPVVKLGVPRPEVIRAMSGQVVTAEELDAQDDLALAFSNNSAVVATGAPGAGMVADASAVALFYQHLLHDPRHLWESRIRTSAISEVRNAFPEEPRFGALANRTIGCLLISGDESTRIVLPELGYDASARHHGEKVSSGTFGHGGAGGQIAFADPRRGISFAYLTNGFNRDYLADARRSQELIDAVIDAVDDAQQGESDDC